MKHSVMVFGAMITASLMILMLVIGSQAQLFSFSGNVQKPPAYNLVPTPKKYDVPFVDALTYDANGQVIDFAKYGSNPTAPPTQQAAAEGECVSQRFEYKMSGVKFWKKGSKVSPSSNRLRSEIEKILNTCSPILENQAPLSCAPGCSAGEDKVETTPLLLELIAADYSAPDIFQYVFIAKEGSCMRTLQCH